jgi:mRNA interferase RelE/StbE
MLSAARAGSSSRYRIFETREYAKRLARLSPDEREFIARKVTTYVYPQLRHEPHSGLNVKKLLDYEPETWRYRIGRYRLFFSIDEVERIVFILTVELRRDAYR